MNSKHLILKLLFILASSSAHALPDIVFVTQAPHPQDFATINATFANHLGSLEAGPRGGDLYIRYSDGTLRNLTEAAGYGGSGYLTSNAISVRDPVVHWDAQKILFSMLIGAPSKQYELNKYNWQLYEITNFGKNQTPVISKVANQPDGYNNVMATYSSDDQIIFASDKPPVGLEHTYPQRDEYESTPTNTGLWKLNPDTGDIFHMDHSPSGDFHPSIDSFGRTIFTRWDHLQRDQQNRCSNADFHAFNYSSEDKDAEKLDEDTEVYPEARGDCDPETDANLNRHSFNHFLPWQINQDGTNLETINHVGRHELVDYIPASFNDDSNIEEFYGQYNRYNENPVENVFQISESPLTPGLYYAINAPEFGTHASGQIISFSASPDLTSDKIQVNYVTHQDTANVSESPSSSHIGLSRDPQLLSNSTLIASHTANTKQDHNTGTTENPGSYFAYRLRSFSKSGSYYVPDQYLTSGITKTISYWSPDVKIEYSNVTMWELQPKEVRVRERPSAFKSDLPQIESEIFDAQSVNVDEFKDYLKDNNLALIVSRNVTTRDELDHQQPRNITVSDSNTKSKIDDGKMYTVSDLQIFQGDLIRGYDTGQSKGRRIIPQTMHSVFDNPTNESGPDGSVKIAADGSFAALVPARKPVTYQLTDPDHQGVVRERLWLTFQPGEIRVCASCHGVNSKDQAGNPPPENPPLALQEFLEYWQSIPKEDPKLNLESSTKTVSTRKKSAKKRVALELEVQAENQKAVNRPISIESTLGGQICSNILQFTLSDLTASTFTSKPIPIKLLDQSLTFKAKLYGNVISETTFSLSKNKIRKSKRKNSCKALKRAFKRYK